MRKGNVVFLVFFFLLWVGTACQQAPEIMTERPSGTAVTELPTPTNTPLTPSPEPTMTATPQPTAITPTIPTVPEIAFQPGEFSQGKMQVDGEDREYAIYVPSSWPPDEPVALVVNLHGLGGTYLQHDFITNFSAKAEEAGFVVVYPIGKGATWHLATGAERAADVAFIRQLALSVQAALPIDERRIYATGASMGGGMANRLGCDAADIFAAIAPVAAVYTDFSDCWPANPIAFVAVHGTDDDGAFYDGRQELGLPSVPGLAQAWAVQNGCGPQPVRTEIEPSVWALHWRDCPQNVEVALYTLEGFGHGWPNFGTMSARSSDPEFQATDVIWDFFAAHPKEP